MAAGIIAALFVFAAIPLAIGFVVQALRRQRVPSWAVAIAATLLAVPGWAGDNGFRITLANMPTLGFVATAAFLFGFLRIGADIAFQRRQRRNVSVSHRGGEA